MAIVKHYRTGQRKNHAGLCKVPGVYWIGSDTVAVLPAFAFIPKASVPMPKLRRIIAFMLHGIHESVKDGSYGNK
jgi:hypothetical protein